MEATVVRSVSENPLLRAILSSQLDADLVKLIMTRSVPFTEIEYLEVYVYLLRIRKIKDRVVERLKEIPDQFKTRYLQHRTLNLRTAYYLLMESIIQNKLENLSVIINHKHLPHIFLEKIAQLGSAEALELLLENQQTIIKHPGLLGIIRANPRTSSFIESTIKELEELIQMQQKDSAIQGLKKKIIPRIQDISSEDLVGEEEEFEILDFEEDEGEEEELPPGEKEEREKEEEKRYQKQISNMSVPEKVLLARIGNSRDRLNLVRDANKLVSKSVVESPKLNEAEVCQIANNRSLDKDVICALARNKKWQASYKIVSALALNPKTPVNEAMGFTRRLTNRDLRLISKDRNTNPVIRNFARQLLDTKQ